MRRLYHNLSNVSFAKTETTSIKKHVMITITIDCQTTFIQIIRLQESKDGCQEWVVKGGQKVKRSKLTCFRLICRERIPQG